MKKLFMVFLLLHCALSCAMADKDRRELRAISERSKNEEKQEIKIYALLSAVSFSSTLFGLYESRNFLRTMYDNEMQQRCSVRTQSSLKDSQRVVGCIVCGIVTCVVCLGLCDHCQRHCKYKKALRDL